MPIIPDAPLTKITLNLYTADVTYLQSRFISGYTEEIRKIVRMWVREDKENRHEAS